MHQLKKRTTDSVLLAARLYPFEQGQTRSAAQQLAAAFQTQRQAAAAPRLAVCADAHFPQVAEAPETGIAANLVHDVLIQDLVFDLKQSVPT